jgi:hypothetical protein
MPGKVGGARLGAGRKDGAKARANPEQKATLSELAREHTATALETLVYVMKNSESDSNRVAASIAILDRAYGRPPQAVMHSGADGGAIKTEDVTTPERRRAALALLLAQH